MKKLIQNITLITLSFVVVFTTGGINIYKHYCFCTGETTQSFFEVGDQCNHTENHHCLNEPGQANQSHACCSVDKPENSENKRTCKKDHNCCNNEYTFFKTDQYDYSKSVKRTFEFVAAYQSDLSSDRNGLVSQLNELRFAPKNNPPPTYGIELLTEIHQLKLAHSHFA